MRIFTVFSDIFNGQPYIPIDFYLFANWISSGTPLPLVAGSCETMGSAKRLKGHNFGQNVAKQEGVPLGGPLEIPLMTVAPRRRDGGRWRFGCCRTGPSGSYMSSSTAGRPLELCATKHGG